jgi:hypothetical protein
MDAGEESPDSDEVAATADAEEDAASDVVASADNETAESEDDQDVLLVETGRILADALDLDRMAVAARSSVSDTDS